MPTSFIKSTIERRQPSFSFVAPARPSSTTETSTTGMDFGGGSGTGGASTAAEALEAETYARVARDAFADGAAVAGVAPTASGFSSGSPPKILEAIFLKPPITYING